MPCDTIHTSTAERDFKMSVAQNIVLQLGGNRFRTMTGAKDFVGGENHLTFKLPANFAKNKINLVKIELNGNDLYDVTYYYLRGVNLRVVHKDENVFCGDLQRFF